MKVFGQSFQERQEHLVVFVFGQRAITGLIVDLAQDDRKSVSVNKASSTEPLALRDRAPACLPMPQCPPVRAGATRGLAVRKPAVGD